MPSENRFDPDLERMQLHLDPCLLISLLASRLVAVRCVTRVQRRRVLHLGHVSGQASSHLERDKQRDCRFVRQVSKPSALLELVWVHTRLVKMA